MKKILLYNINTVLAFELRKHGDFDYFGKWNYNIRPKPNNIEEIDNIDPNKYKCAVSENFKDFQHDIKKVEALDIPYLSYEHYSYTKKSNLEITSGGYVPFTNENEMRLFVKVASNQKMSFIGSKINICKNIEIPTIDEIQNFTDSAPISLFYAYLNILGSHLSYLNVTKRKFNFNIYEAMLLGLPIISVKIDPDLKHGICGLFSDDPYELRSFVTYLNENPETAIKMGVNAKKFIENKFKTSSFHKEWEKVLS